MLGFYRAMHCTSA